MWTREKYELACAIDQSRRDVPEAWNDLRRRNPWRAVSRLAQSLKEGRPPPRALKSAPQSRSPSRGFYWILGAATAGAATAAFFWKRARKGHPRG